MMSFLGALLKFVRREVGVVHQYKHRLPNLFFIGPLILRLTDGANCLNGGRTALGALRCQD